MVTLQQLCEYINEILEVENFSDYCPNGLQIEGDQHQPIEHLGVAVSASALTIEKAAEEGVQALLVHHGLFWKGDPFPIIGSKKKKIVKLLEEGISLLAYHLPLDAHQQVGNNWYAAKQLGWQDLQPFGVFNGVPIGVKGSFPAIDREVFQQQLEEYYQHGAHCALGGKQKISSAALVSGGAYRSLLEAANEGVDCFVTGNFDEPAWHMAFEEKINFYALGHSATETIGPKALAQKIFQEFGVKTSFFDDKNPF